MKKSTSKKSTPKVTQKEMGQFIRENRQWLRITKHWPESKRKSLEEAFSKHDAKRQLSLLFDEYEMLANFCKNWTLRPNLGYKLTTLAAFFFVFLEIQWESAF